MATDTEYLADLEKTIRLRCRCSANHRQTVFVHEKTGDGETIWIGDVEVFDLNGSRNTSACYAWQSLKSGIRVVTILQSRLVDSAQRAVQAAIFSGVESPMLDRPANIKQRTEKVRNALYQPHIKADEWEAMTRTVQQITASSAQKIK